MDADQAAKRVLPEMLFLRVSFKNSPFKRKSTKLDDEKSYPFFD
ncbi:MAG: hypothetical protein OEW45_10825 [Deltaproteobacteria bacterium]|nr:hypothetical protein [Deltaproteobacteria bacterium]